MHVLAGNAECLQVLAVFRIRRGVRDVGDRLGCLADRNVCDHRVARGVAHDECAVVFQTDIDPRAVARRPNAVRKLADGNGGDRRKIVGAERLDLVQAAERDVCERRAS
jgi:hypothetical protein